MGIGVKKGELFTKISVPLVSGENKDWSDNTWLVEHLRQLAQMIEDENPQIHNIGIEIDANYKIPNLIVKSFN